MTVRTIDSQSSSEDEIEKKKEDFGSPTNRARGKRTRNHDETQTQGMYDEVPVTPGLSTPGLSTPTMTGALGSGAMTDYLTPSRPQDERAGSDAGSSSSMFSGWPGDDASSVVSGPAVSERRFTDWV